MSIKDGVSTYEHAARVNSSSAGASDKATSGPTFQTASMGSKVAAADARDNDIVTLPGSGMQTTVKAAIASGLLSPDFRSSPSDPSSAPRAAAVESAASVEEQKQQATESNQSTESAEHSPYSDFNSSKPVELPGQAESLMQQAVAKMSHGTAHSVIGTVLAGREVSQDQLHQVGRQLGVLPEEAQSRLNTVMDGMRQQVVNAVGNEVVAWAQRNDPAAVQKASQAQAVEGSLRGWGDLNARYMQALEKDNPQAIVQSKDGQRLGARVEQDRTVTLELPNVGRVGWQTALRSGFIAPRYGQVPTATKTAAPQAQQQVALRAQQQQQFPQMTRAVQDQAHLRIVNSETSAAIQQIRADLVRQYGEAQVRRYINLSYKYDQNMGIKIKSNQGSGFDYIIPGAKPAEPKRVDGIVPQQQRQAEASAIEKALHDSIVAKQQKQQAKREDRSALAGAAASMAVALEQNPPGTSFTLPDGTVVRR